MIFKNLRRIRMIATALVAVLSTPQLSYSQDIQPADIISAATNTLGKFTPLSIAANSLINTAIDKGNSDLKDRLDQANGIIQSAIFNLNQVIKERVQDLDQKVRIQRMEAIRELDNLSVNISNTLKVSFDKLNEVLAKNIAGFQNALANSFASLPIPTEPLINVSETGLTLIANSAGPTKLVITGSGLYKDGKPPEAWVHEGANDKKGTRLDVESTSMGLLTVVFPPQIIPTTDSPKFFNLSLGFYKGWFQTVWPSFPLTLCGALPRYSVRATLSATDGAYWLGKDTPRQWFYIDRDQTTITAAGLAPPGWTVDTSKGTYGGLTIVWDPPTSPGGNGEHNEVWLQDTSGYRLWVGGKGGNSHAFAFASVKQVQSQAQCGTTQETKDLDYDSLNQIQFKKSTAMGNCDVSLKTPNVLAVVELIRQGKVVETMNVPIPTHDKTAFGDLMNLSLDNEGLLNITLKPSCAQKFSYRVLDR